MTYINKLERHHEQMCLWRRHIHSHPETAFEEFDTSEFIADKLKSFGMQIHQGLAKTGIVASLSAGSGSKKIALRADMDALPIQELNDLPYKSRHDGKMHACGHDGHSAMLLGAANYLTEHRDFNGTVYFIFQPAEEGRAGAQQMITEGLFDLFPAQSVYGMHNFPDIPQGHFAVKPGPMMAAFDCFKITIIGTASHAAIPHSGKDPIVAAGQIINAMQTIVSRNINPADSAVVSFTQIHAGSTFNSIPESVILGGTYRCFKKPVQDAVKQHIMQLVHGICDSFGVRAEILFNPENPGYPVTFNTETETDIARQAATEIVGQECVDTNPEPSMGSEDFAYMLQEKPGCYIWIGNGSSKGGCLLHNPHYDFNDEILPIGAAYWVKLVETVLEK